MKVIVIGGCFFFCCAAALHAEPSYQVEYGFRGFARPERPMPVQVFLQGDNVDRQLMVRITGTPMVYLPVELPRETRKHLFVYTEPATSRLPGGLPRLEILEGRRQIHEEILLARSPSTYFVPVVGGPSLEFSSTTSPRVTAASMPREPRGYAGLNALVIYPGGWDGIHPAALQALSIWVQGGGTLLLPTVAGARTLALPAGHPFGPLKSGRIEPKPGFFSWMEHALGLSEVDPDRIDFEDPWDRATLAAPPSTAWRVFPADNLGGEEAIELPTVLARQRYGKGNLYFVCFDLAVIPPSREWGARETFVRRLLASSGGPSSILATDDPLLRDTDDVSRLVLPGTTGRTSTGWFFLFLVVYLVLIVPADYWLVRRLGRPRLTWLSFPVIVLLFSLFAWGLGRGRIGSTEYREITWIDALLPGKTTALAHSVVGIYSDTNQRFTITPVADRAEVRRGLRASGAAVDYDGRISAGAMVQKMHIWSDHGYRVVWPTERLLDSATLYRDAAGSGVLRVTGVLPREPVFWRVRVAGNDYNIPHSAVRVLDGEGWDLRLVDHPLGPDEWEQIGGAAVGQEGIGALADEFYGASRSGRTAWVAAVLPGAWPALRIAERSPEQVGAVVVRVRVRVEVAE